MPDIKKLKLTKDPLTNINLMVPLLNDQARKAVSYFMYGCCVGESIATDNFQKNPQGQLQEV